MTNAQTLKGYWWNPGAPQRKWFGVLTQTDAVIELVCHSGEGDVELAQDSPSATVHGRDEKGRPVTLLFASRQGSSKSSALETTRLHPAYVLVGIHVARKDAIRVQSVSLCIQHLYGWLGLTGFSPNPSGLIAADGSGHVTINYVFPKKERHEFQEGNTISFGISSNYSATIQAQSVEEDAYVSMTQKDGFTFEQVWQRATVFRSLLHFAAPKPVYLVAMTLTGVTEDGCAAAADAPEVVVWSRNFHEAETMPRWEDRWVFHYLDIPGTFGEFFRRWLAYRERYREAFDCCAATVYHALPSSVALICLTQALDAYHGIRFDSHGDHGFRSKVQELIALNPMALSGLVPDVAEFAERVLHTRNYYTHHNPKWLPKAAQGAELIKMNALLRIIFQACVLREMDLPDSCLSKLRCQIPSKIVEY